MLRSALLAFLTLLLSVLVTLPSPSTAQPIVHAHYPDRLLHGWVVSDFATSQDPSGRNQYYIIDGHRHIVVIDAVDGRVIRNVSFTDQYHWLGRIAVDRRGYVFVTADGDDYGSHLKVLDASLRPVKNVSLVELQPALYSAYSVQVVVDSTNSIYLFDESGQPGMGTNGVVWVLGPRQFVQQSVWKAPISSNFTDRFIMAIDNQDYLYFQARSGYKMLYITDQSGALQSSYQLGSGSMASPSIEAVAIDAQLQMWHTHSGSTMVSVLDSNGNLISMPDVLSSASWGWTSYVAVDALNNVIVSDRQEQALLHVTANGNILRTLRSQVPAMWYVTELLADYSADGGGRGRMSGSLMFGDWNSPWVVQRISVHDDDAGSLLQQIALPRRLSDQCNDFGLDNGMRTGNIYVLLRCVDRQDWHYYALMYVMTQSGRLVAEFRVHDDASRVRADEWAGVVYVTTDSWNAPWGDSILAYSMMDGSQVANYTTTNPKLDYIVDFTIMPPTEQGNGPTIVAVDYFNRRFVNIDPSGNSPVVTVPFRNDTYCDSIAFSPSAHGGLLFYVGCTSWAIINSTYVRTSFVHKWDVTDPNKPALTDTFIGLPGTRTEFGPLVVGLDGHLYAFEMSLATVYQWRDADGPPRPPSSEQQDSNGPRVHVGGPHIGLSEMEAAGMSKPAGMPVVRPSAGHRHRLVRGARGDRAAR